MQINALRAALNSSKRFAFKEPESAVDYLVVGGGVVGLAVARHLTQRFPDKTTFLLERHVRAGEETSARNSEVIHAGLYYPPDSLKTRLCLRGRQLMYDYCTRNAIPHRKLGKLVVAHADQTAYIESLHRKALALSAPPRWDASAPVLPTRLIDGAEARELEPALSDAIAGALHSPETGIVDSHALMESFERDIADAGGALAYATRVVRVDPAQTDAGWVVQAATSDGEPDALLARTLVNASGLAGPMILNAFLPPERRLPMYFARGSYASYSGPGVERVSHLLYPCPASAKSTNAHGFQSLGTHLTLDMQGRVRFGPDLEWLAPPAGREDDEDAVDFWTRHLVPDDSRVQAMHAAVTSYLPRVTYEDLQPDYVGVRPKLVGPGGGFQDFVLRLDMSEDFGGRRGAPMVSLLGIESPGLTASMAIAEAVVEDILVAKELDVGQD